MHCSDFHRRLDTVLDDRQNPAADPILTAHAASCHSCRRYLHGQAALLAGLSRMQTPTLDASFSRRVVVLAAPAIRPARAPRRLRRISWALGVALSSAAATLLAISIVWYAHRRDLAVVDANQAPPQVEGLRSRFPRIAWLAPPYFGPKSNPRPAPKITIADVLLESPRWPSRWHGYRDALDEWAIAERLEEFEQLSPAIRPLRASLAVIWDTLCRTIPIATRNDSPSPARDGTGFFLHGPLGVA